MRISVPRLLSCLTVSLSLAGCTDGKLALPGGDSGADARDTDGSVGGPAKSLVWGTSETLATATDVALAFNNTAVGLRLEDGTALVGWTAAGEPRLGRRAPGQAWQTIALPRASTGAATKVTLAHLGGQSVIAAWTESAGPNAQAVASLSTDGGVTFSPSRVVSAPMVGALAVSLVAIRPTTGSASALFAWSQTTNSTANYVRWTGPNWDSAAFSTPQPIESETGTSHDVALTARNERVVASWEDDSVTPVVSYYRESNNGGASFGAVRPLLVGPNATSNNGQDSSGCIDGQGRVLFAMQTSSQVYLSRLGTGGAFESLGRLGPGLFAHTVCDTEGFVAVSWEHFEGDFLNDANKTIGLSVILNAEAAIDGPHAMPASEAAFRRLQGALVLSSQALDVYWIDATNASRTLQHAEATIIR